MRHRILAFSLCLVFLPVKIHATPGCVDYSDYMHIVGNVVTPTFQLNCAEGVAMSGNYAYVADKINLLVIDISVPSVPVLVGSVPTPGSSQNVVVQGTYAYVADTDSLVVIDIGTPSSPAIVGTLGTPGYLYDVAVSGNYAYLPDTGVNGSGLLVADISTPSAPAVVWSDSVSVYSVATAGGYLYTADGDTLRVFDISAPSMPTLLGGVATNINDIAAGPGFVCGINTSEFEVIDASDPANPLASGPLSVFGAYGVAVDGMYAYVAEGDYGLHVFDVSTLSAPSSVGSVGGLEARSVATANGYAYLGRCGMLTVIDIDPVVPAPVFNSLNVSPLGLATSPGFAYVTGTDKTLRVIDVSTPASPSIVGILGFPQLAWDIVVAGTYAYVDVETSSSSDLYVVDVSDPTTPAILGNVSFTPSYSYRALDVAGSFAYVVINTTLHVVDISTPATPADIASVNLSASMYGIDVWGNYAYVAGDGFRVVDIGTPATPVVVASADTIGGWGVTVFGDHAYLPGTELTIVDVSVPASPAVVGSLTSPSPASAIVVTGGFGYLAAEDAGTQVVDLSNLAAPVLVGSIYHGAWWSHRIALSGGYLYVANSYELTTLEPECAVMTAAGSPARVTGLSLWSEPNPFNPTTEIRYEIPQAGHVTLTIYNVAGQRVALLVNEPELAGPHAVRFDARNDSGGLISSGVYFAVLETGGAARTLKIVMLK